MKAYAGIQYRDDVDVAMAEKRMTLKYRVPDKQRLEWAQRIVAEMGDRIPKTPTEVYAREQIILHESSRPRSWCRHCASATSASPPRRTRPMPSPA
jgi:hypothetical protein